MTFQQCQRKLAIVWLIGAAVVFLLLFVRTLSNQTPVVTLALWKWLLPNLMPTLSLIVGVVVVVHRRDMTDSGGEVDAFVFRLAQIASIFYLILVLALIALPPVLQPNVNQSTFLNDTGLFIGPLQGIVSALVGVFFIKEHRRVAAGTRTRPKPGTEATPVKSN